MGRSNSIESIGSVNLNLNRKNSDASKFLF